MSAITVRQRTFVVTGAASGIGQATARALKAAGARLVLWDVSEEALSSLADELDASYAAVDVTDMAAVRAATDKALADGGTIDGLVNSAGIMRSGLFWEIAPEEHAKVVAINLIGTMNVAWALYPHVRATRGSLVFMGSISGAYGPPEFASYGASKAGVINFCEALALEGARDGVHVGVVNPFFVNTPMVDANADTTLIKNVGTAHTPEEIAAAILSGIEHRRRMIFPSWRPRAVWALSRQLSFLGHPLMGLNWRYKGLARIWRRS